MPDRLVRPRKALEGKPFSHQGKYCTIPPKVPYRDYTLKEITLVPAAGAAAGRMLAADPERLRARFDFMAKYGIRGGLSAAGRPKAARSP